MRTDGIINPSVFHDLSPSRYLCFSFPNPLPSLETPYADTLRVAVADAPSSKPQPSPPAIAAILVPPNREDDWIFCTPAGHFQLLLSLPISRLLLIGDLPATTSLPRPYHRPNPGNNRRSLVRFQENLLPLLLALCPRSAFVNGTPSIPFLFYEDDVIRSTFVERLVGPVAGEMLVEDVEIDRFPAPSEFRRRLRFKSMPNLVQSQVRLLPGFVDTGVIRAEMGSLVQPYLGPMVSAFFLNASAINEAILCCCLPRVLCLGVGGGPLLSCLRNHFDFRVFGVEADDVVLSVARRYFGLVEGEFLKVVVSDGIKLIENYALEQSESGLFHAIMVDLDEGDPLNGVGAPPMEFLRKGVLVGARMALHREGVMVVNVITSSNDMYARIVKLFRNFFCELYEIEVENGDNCVLIATASPVKSDWKEMKQGIVFEKLKQLNCERFVDAIKKI